MIIEPAKKKTIGLNQVVNGVLQNLDAKEVDFTK
jgi:hypothetical protein